MNAEARPHLIRFFIRFGILCFLYVFSLKPAWVQSVYADHIYPYISSAQRLVASYFPFSIGDILYILLCLYVLRRLVLFLKKHKNKLLIKPYIYLVPLQGFNFLLALYIVFKLLWGLNYSRPGIAGQLGISHQAYTNKELVALGDYFITHANQLKTVQKQHTGPDSLIQIKDLAIKSYQNLGNKNLLFKYKNPAVKSALSSWLTSKMGIEGYYNPLSGEANINSELPAFVLPYTLCHEIAHQIGIAYEDEANLAGYLTALHTKNVHFKYAAYYAMLRYILFEIRIKSPDDYKQLYKKINPEVLADFKTENEFWQKYNNRMYAFMDVAFDQFLKLNNQDKGIKSYQNIVLWLYNYHKSELK